MHKYLFFYLGVPFPPTISNNFESNGSRPRLVDKQLFRENSSSVTKTIILAVVFFCISLSKSFAQAPVITSFSPASGPVGTSVTVTGSGFSSITANNIVFFGATMATVTSETPNSITVTVPAGSTYQPISVLNSDTHLTAYSSKPFLSTFTPNKGAINTEDLMPPIPFNTGGYSSDIKIGDIDGDGKPDLIMANEFDQTISIFRNTSIEGTLTSTSFAPKVDFALNDSPYQLAIGDLDGDGKIDIVVTNLESAHGTYIAVFKNRATPGELNANSFAPKFDLETRQNAGGIIISDLDGDGKPDIAVTNVGDAGISIWRNASTSGSLAPASFEARVDIANTLSTGGFADSYGLAAGDLDGDGKIDLAVTVSYSNIVSVFKNKATVGPFNSNTSFATPVVFSVGNFPFHVIIGDLDGDGLSDITSVNLDDNSISILHNNSIPGTITSSSFAPSINFTTGGSPRGLSIGDLDGDGKPDIVITNSSANSVSIFRNASMSGSFTTSSFTTKIDLTVGNYPIAIAIGDLDGDGKADLATTVDIASATGNYVSVIRNNPILPPVATLLNLIPSSGTLNPVFDSAIQKYADSVGNLTTGITLTPTSTDPKATITVNGVSVISGNASPTIPLTVGSNTITTVVTAQDGLTTDIYTVVVIRAASSNDTLTNLTVSQGTLSPTFNSGTKNYTDSVTNAVASLTVTPTASEPTAKIIVNGTVVNSGTASPAISLNVGSNTITTVVTAPDGVTTGMYTITVIRAPSSNAALIDLTVSEGTLTPAFSSGVTTYADSVSNLVTSITATPTVSDSNATITVNGETVISGNMSLPLPLVAGINTVTVVVTAQDGVTIKTYIVNVYRGESIASINTTNILTPNGDGKNDYWLIKDIQFYPQNNVKVFDKAGRTVYVKNGYNNEWDGTLNGRPLAEGTYYFVVDLGPNLRKFKGFISILRN